MILQYYKRFKSIDRIYLYTDKHIHSKWTDGEGSIFEIAKKSSEMGLRHIAISDHIRSSSTFFDEYYKEAKKVSKELNIEILAGFEAKIKNFQGDIDACEEVAKKAEIRIASVHRFPIGRKLYEAHMFEKRICQEIELELTIAALNKRSFDVLGHAGGMSLKAYNEFPLNFFEEIILECKRNEVVFEINCNYHLPVLDVLMTLLSKYNIFISFGSDAHKLPEIGGWLNILNRKRWIK